MSQLWVVVGFGFGGRRGPVSFRAVRGKGGESALEFGGGVVAVCFCFGASQLPGCEGEEGPVSFGVVLFCGEWRRVSFRGL